MPEIDSISYLFRPEHFKDMTPEDAEFEALGDALHDAILLTIEHASERSEHVALIAPLLLDKMLYDRHPDIRYTVREAREEARAA